MEKSDYAQVFKIMKELGEAKQSIDIDDALDEIEVDPDDLGAALEDELDVQITTDDVQSWVTVGDVFNTLRKYM